MFHIFYEIKNNQIIIIVIKVNITGFNIFIINNLF